MSECAWLKWAHVSAMADENDFERQSGEDMAFFILIIILILLIFGG